MYGTGNPSEHSTDARDFWNSIGRSLDDIWALRRPNTGSGGSPARIARPSARTDPRRARFPVLSRCMALVFEACPFLGQSFPATHECAALTGLFGRNGAFGDDLDSAALRKHRRPVGLTSAIPMALVR